MTSKSAQARIKHERLCKYIQKASKFEFNDPKHKHFWKTSIDELEEESKEYDLSACLPKKLHARVSKIIPIIPLEEDKFEEEKEIEIPDDYVNATENELDEFDLDKDAINKLTEMQQDYEAKEVLDLKLEKETVKRKPNTFAANWMVDYFRKHNQERVIWQTKLYEKKRRFEDKPLFEQVEELTDLSAKSFVTWLNELGQEKSEVTEEMIKKLFSIGIEEGVSKALKFGSTHTKVIPDTLATYWNIPKKAFGYEIERARHREKMYRTKPDKKIAFGKTLPMDLRHQNELFDEPEIIPPVFRKIRTFEGIFKGITHLTSIGLLVEYLKENPNIERPKHLIDLGLFEEKKIETESQKTPQKSLFESAKQ
uniref:CSON005336 protein n=1 Tax=Culicoides sonorensis TaxID=179676 RepID=A0A336MQ95_CULSO